MNLPTKLVWAGEREAIVPGVSYVGDGRADVMRGEEVQLLGAVAAGMVDPMALVCHPGTHNKWATLRHGQIDRFRTVMTGELFNLLKEHSILSDLLRARSSRTTSFKRRARHGLDNEALPADLFASGPGAARAGEEGGCGILCQRPVDRRRRADRAVGPDRRRKSPSWGDRTLPVFTRRPSRSGPRARSSSTASTASSPAFTKSRRGSA